MRIIFTSFFFLLFVLPSYAQIVVGPLNTNPVLTRLYDNGKLQLSFGEKDGTTLHLPFIDDFSKNHQPGAAKVLWEDNFVFINPTYGFYPPTIGVATFDGLDFNGYPYDFENPLSYGTADVLTSCPINLNQDEDGDFYAPSDSIYLSFFYQPEGLGDSPEEQDSLILEFFNPTTELWDHQWSSPGAELTSFFKIYISIVNDQYLNDGFKFRFRNYATLSGNLDHWNIDMVWLDKNRSVTEMGFPDVGFQYPVNQLLAAYTSMPYSHYQLNAESYMINVAPAQLINNHPNAVNLSNVKMLNYSEGSLVNETAYPGNIENFPGQSANVYYIPVNEGSDNYYFDDAIDEPFVSFENKFVMTSGTFDLVEDNDTIEYTQRLENYYSYDDGSAEAGIGLNIQGGRLLSKYQSVIGDSIIGFSMYFNPIVNLPVYPFYMLVYEDESAMPGDLIHIDENYDFVTYTQEGHDIFGTYWLDSAVYVNGDFYIGIAQTSETSLNLGLDRNIDSHDKMFYNYGSGWIAMEESVFGSLMMRPIFTSDMDSILLGIEEKVELITRIYPNPARDYIQIETEDEDLIHIEIYSMDGRLQVEDNFFGNTKISTDGLSNGMYIVRMKASNGSMSTKKIMIQHQ